MGLDNAFGVSLGEGVGTIFNLIIYAALTVISFLRQGKELEMPDALKTVKK